ncbi:hypothetical protein F751_6023 [Auxenochlorella protothecoides]|uniref:Uncharacterized protein n=1 Tax=Auxenochlorella protothecoides TaxID=3075 RepID=A0A087SCL5_AUXPR|nr:hypothetical protein F751_6023 [Auxenochlorella protothecoides]KFM23469.1 hypothetical protein F751_6023 [Auxenochlorella protothecoides]
MIVRWHKDQDSTGTARQHRRHAMRSTPVVDFIHQILPLLDGDGCFLVVGGGQDVLPQHVFQVVCRGVAILLECTLLSVQGYFRHYVERDIWCVESAIQ